MGQIEQDEETKNVADKILTRTPEKALELSGVHGSIEEYQLKRSGTAGTTWTSTRNAGKARKDLDENVTILNGIYPTIAQR